MAWTKLKTGIVLGAVALLAAGTATITIHQLISRTEFKELRFAGYATPEASVQSMLWSGSQGDFNGCLKACTPDQAQRFENKMLGKSEEEISREAKAWANSLKDYKITRKDVISENEVHLHIRATPSADGLRDGTTTIVMLKVGDVWKQQGEL